MKCVACGSEALVEGSVVDAGSGGAVVFSPKDVPRFKSMLGIGMRAVRAYGCVHCQHLQLAVDFNEKDLERYLEFEGQQPDLLERINSEHEDARK
ncbi:MAG: hypothetical protein WCD76_10100 [Pyrinomonadaceae bacterium]